MICPNCRTKTNLTFKAYGGVCPTCVRYIYPGIMTICDMGTGAMRLWNAEAKKYENLGTITSLLNYFGQCGWEVRTRQLINRSHVPRVDITIYYLHYFGDKVCCRLAGYPFFNPTAHVCTSRYCHGYMPAEGGSQGPVERSFFEQWILNRYSPNETLSLLPSRLRPQSSPQESRIIKPA